MKRTVAARRHRRFVAIIAGLAGAIIVLLATVVPRVEAMYHHRGIELADNPAALFVIRVSHLVIDHLGFVLALTAVLIALLWTIFHQIDRPRA